MKNVNKSSIIINPIIQHKPNGHLLFIYLFIGFYFQISVGVSLAKILKRDLAINDKLLLELVQIKIYFLNSLATFDSKK
jgi:hypothetical protein